MVEEYLLFASNLRAAFREHMNVLADHLALGKARDWDEYNKVSGQINGLAIAEEALLDLVEKTKKNSGEEG